MYFPQVHPPGRSTSPTAGNSGCDRRVQLILSGMALEVAAGETFLAFRDCSALWTLGGSRVVRSDNTALPPGSAEERQLRRLLDHLGHQSRPEPCPPTPQGRHRPGPHPAGQPRTPPTTSQLRPAAWRDQSPPEGKLELACLGPLPPAPVPEYVNYQSKVRRWCTIQVAGPSVQIRLRRLGGSVLPGPPGGRPWRGWPRQLPPRHWVRRKPGVRYRFREQLFPTMHFRPDLRRAPGKERADVELRILGGHHHGSHGGSLLLEASPSTTRRCGTWRAQGARSSGADPVWPAGPEDLRPPAQSAWLRRGCAHDGHQRDAGPHAANSSCPPWAPRSPRLATAMGNFPGVPSPPPAHQPAAPGVALWQDLGDLRAPPHTPAHEAATPGQLRRARHQRPGWTARHRQDSRPLRPGPPPGGSRPLRPLRSGLPFGAGAPRRQARPGPTPVRKLDNFDFLLLGPGCPRAPRSPAHTHRRTLRSLGITPSRSGNGQPHGHRRGNRPSITPQDVPRHQRSPATRREPAKLIDANRKYS